MSTDCMASPEGAKMDTPVFPDFRAKSRPVITLVTEVVNQNCAGQS